MEAAMRFVIFCLVCMLNIGIANAKPVFYVRAFKEGDKYEGSVVVKPLDDPGNPYKDQYDDYDRWCVDHVNEYITLENHSTWQIGLDRAQGSPWSNKMHSGNVPTWDPAKALTLTYTVVDKDGFVVPHQWRGDGSESNKIPTVADTLKSSDKKWAPDPAGFWSLGYMEPELNANQSAGIDRAIASGYPPIPQWMVAQNKDTVLLPDGGAIFLSDALNAPADVAAKYSGGTLYAQRFSSDGVEVKAILYGGYFGWSKILSDKPIKNEYFRMYEKPMASGDIASYNNLHGLGGRYEIYRDFDNGGALAVLDYWQDKVFTPQEDGADFLDKLTYDWHYFQQVDAQQLARIYLAQQEAKQ